MADEPSLLPQRRPVTLAPPLPSACALQPTLRLIGQDDGAFGTAAREAGILPLTFNEYYETIMPSYLPILIIGWCSGRLLVAAGADVYAPREAEQPPAAPAGKGKAEASAGKGKSKAS